MPLQATSGAASYDAFGGGVAAVPNYIEDVFSTYLYTGTGASQTITNGIDLSTYGGLWWGKGRSNPGNLGGHGLVDTVRGKGKMLQSNTTGAQFVTAGDEFVTSFNTNGVTIGNDNTFNRSGELTVGWTFRKQPKFFTCLTYTGNGTVKTVNHNLGSVPGVMIVKCTSAAGENWAVYHRSLGATKYLELNNTNAASTSVGSRWGAEPTSTSFSVGYNGSVNSSGATYVAYLFAHNAGGFGLTGTDNVISCGSFTTNGSANATVDLGYEPQLVIAKRTDGSGAWCIQDNMRGFTARPTTYSANPILFANDNNAEITGGANTLQMTATGFTTDNISYNANSTYIYIAIRRGPMKVPTSGTSVFAPVATSGSTGATHTIGFPLDLQMSNYRTGSFTYVSDRLRGVDSTTNETAYPFLKTSSTDAETTSLAFTRNVNNTSFQTPSFFDGTTQIYWNFRRAPGFFDEVCYTGTGSATTQAHNLGVAPELMIVKRRDSANSWNVYAGDATKVMYLNSTIANTTYGVWNNTAPTTTQFTISSFQEVNASGSTYVAYLFATCAGVSKCFNYTGNGSSQTINCGFTAGARWILIKRTDSTGDWYVWDSARGIVSGNDPHLSLNSTAAEVTTDDTIDTDSTGFVVNQVSATNVNVSSATYIGIAIA